MTLFSYGLLNNIQVYLEKDTKELELSKSYVVFENKDGNVKSTEYIMNDYQYNSFKQYINSETPISFT
jgi:hypothetical protein